MKRASAAWHLWRWPAVLGLLTASGLVSALVSDTLGDAWAWLALGVPVGVMVWFGVRRPSAAGRAPLQRQPR